MPKAKITHPGLVAEVHIHPDMHNFTQVTLTINAATHPERLTELRNMLFRAVNTLEPEVTPQWATDLLDVIDKVPR
jgi:hypothetical protein